MIPSSFWMRMIEQNNTRRSVKAGRFLFEKGGVFMATTRIMPLHVGKGRTESSAISDIIDYVANPPDGSGAKMM